ncbi:MAG: IS110 family transposase [Gammaproteobacteria bacterium]|nr:MAG: IS110 family transposase [Gammaproteobacteria bacterium]
MKKHTYRSKNVNKINWEKVTEKSSDELLLFAIDVAKEKQYALLSNVSGTVSELVWWNHPEQTHEMLGILESFSCPLDIVMESTGTYGDAMRHQFRRSGFGIYQISAKRVSDAQEIFDGVPSQHDAKAATLITQLHRHGISKLWVELTDTERSLNALRREYDMHQSQYQRNQNRLEAYLSRHWPEVHYCLELNSVTLENLLIEYGSPERITDDKEAAAIKMRVWGKSQLKDEKINRVIEGACRTLGQPCTEIERQYLQALAEEMRHSRLQQKRAKQAIELMIKSDSELQEMGKLIGLATTAVLLSCHLDPRNYDCASSYLKAFGLNLKEKSSGKHIGQLKLTKRGSSIARNYLYFAALRLIKLNPVAKAWYQSKVDPRARNKTVIAVMRKLVKSLWYVGRGEAFDASKLFTIAEA